MMNVHGYIDRIENGKMVIIAESIIREFIIDYDPSAGMRTGEWVTITLDSDGIITDIQSNPDITNNRKERIGQLKKSLKRRQRG